MTYTSEAKLSNLPADSVNADPTTTEKLKTLAKEGTQRTQRISRILKQAFLETREEFQAGRTVISPIAKEVTAEAVSTFKSKSQQATEAVNQAWQAEESTPDFTERLIKVIKTMASNAKASLFPQVKVQTRKQASKLDELLRDRYGEQYTTIRDRAGQVRTWVGSVANSTSSAGNAATAETAAKKASENSDIRSAAATVIEVDGKAVD